MIQSAIFLMQKDLRGFFRDRGALLASLLLPIALVTVFGVIMAYAFGGGSGGMPAVRLHVLDVDQSEKSKAFVKSLAGVDMVRVQEVDFGDAVASNASETLDRSTNSAAAEQLSKLILDGDSHHALLLEEGFGEAFEATGKPPLKMFRDPGRSMEDQIIAIALMQASFQESDGRLWTGAMTEMLNEQGMDASSVGQIETWMNSIGSTIGDFAESSDDETKVVDGSDENSETSRRGATANAAKETDQTNATDGASVGGTTTEGTASGGMNAMFDFFQQAVEVETEDIRPPGRDVQVTYQQAQSVSGMSVMMLLFALTSSASVLLLEREDGTLRRLFAQPIPRSSVLLGKFFFVFTVGALQLAVLFIYGEWMFDVGLFRDPVTLVVLATTWIATGGAFGMFLASACKSSKQAEGLATLLILCMSALGGCWFPLQIFNLPAWLEILSKCTPTYWAMSGFQGMLWNQLSWSSEKLLLAIAVQWGWALALSVLSVWLFRRNYTAG